MAAEVSTAPIAAEAVQRSDAVFEIECEIIGQSGNQPLALRGALNALVINLEAWMRAQSGRVSIKRATANCNTPYEKQ